MKKTMLLISIMLFFFTIAAAKNIFEQMLLEEIEDKCGSVAKISVSSMNTDIKEIIKIESTGRKLCFSGNKRVVTIASNGDRKMTAFKLKVFKVVPVFTKNIPGDRILTPKDVEMKVSEITRRIYNRTADTVEGVRTKVKVDEGAVVMNRHLRKIDLVRYGEEVKVRLKGGSIVIEMKGIARGNASKNETVPVLNPASKKIIYGTVTGHRTVTLGG
ncbi:MAG: flagellar basal body P-ring formation chaperone FlgA, partial [bacterium]